MKKIASLVAVAALSSIALTGCTINIGTNPNDSNGMMGMNHEGHDSGYSANDIMFAQMMIPHHQQAVDMGTLAETRASNESVKALAAQIKNEQAPEIAQMKTWLTKSGLDANSTHDMDMGMGSGGMLIDEQMAALEASTGSAFDKLYVSGMISHHEGAIRMAQMIINSSNAEAKKLANAIVTSQTAQIAQLKDLLATLK